MFFALYDINAVWQWQIGALLAYNGVEIYWRRNDGVVTWESSDYPNGTHILRIPIAVREINHRQQLASSHVMTQIRDVVGLRFGIPLRDTGGGGGGDGGGSALAATITGPTQVRPTDTCTWLGSGSGGSPPNTYQWSRDGVVVGSLDNYTDALNGASSFTLTLRVTDASSAWTQTEVVVSSNSGANMCLM